MRRYLILNDELFRYDRLHLTEKGYAVWTEIIKKDMNKVIAPPKAQIIAHRGALYVDL